MRRTIKQGISRLLGPGIKKGVFSLGDQAVVSAAGFVTTILVGRVCGPEDLANYSLGLSLVILVRSVLHTLITIPYTIYNHSLTGNEVAEYRGVILIETVVLSVLAAIVLAVWGAILNGAGCQQGLASILYVLSAAIPFVLFREFARHLYFAHLNPQKALWLDAGAVVIQLAGLVLLAAGGWLSGLTATFNLGVANAVVAVTWFIFSLKSFVIRRKQIWPLTKRNWSLGRWILAIRMIGHLNSDIFILWLLTFALGKESTGIFAACMTIIHFSNPFIMGMGQLLTPQISQVLARNGPGEVRRLVKKISLFMGSVLSLFCLLVFFYGGRVMRIIYGDAFGGHTATITVLSFSVLALAISMPVSSGLWAQERSRTTFMAGLLGISFTLPIAFLLVYPLGLLGVAIALTMGITITSLTNGVLFYRLVRSNTIQKEMI